MKWVFRNSLIISAFLSSIASHKVSFLDYGPLSGESVIFALNWLREKSIPRMIVLLSNHFNDLKNILYLFDYLFDI